MTEEQQLLAALAGTDPSQRYSALIAIGKAGLKQHEARVAGYLDETDSELRSAAIRVLAFYWRLPAYRKVAESMMRDPDDHVRAVAVMSWASYRLHSRDQDTLRPLYQIVVDDHQPRRVRDAAYNCFFTVFEPTSAGLPKPALQIDRTIEECVDWARLDAAIEASGTWQPSTPVMQAVTRLSYIGEGLAITLTRDRFEIASDGNTTSGSLQPQSWIRTLGAFDLDGFPTPSASQEGEHIQLEWIRDGKTERVTAFTAPSKYRDVIRVARALGSVRHEQHAPSPVTPGVVSSIEYARGSADAPRGGLRRLTIHSDERFEVLVQHHQSRRTWRGSLNTGTFVHTLALIEAAGFPDPGSQRALTPGEQTRSVGLERGGSWQRVSLYEDDARYVELAKLSSAILAPLDDTLARMPPGMSSPIVAVDPA